MLPDRWSPPSMGSFSHWMSQKTNLHNSICWSPLEKTREIPVISYAEKPRSQTNKKQNTQKSKPTYKQNKTAPFPLKPTFEPFQAVPGCDFGLPLFFLGEPDSHFGFFPFGGQP